MLEESLDKHDGVEKAWINMTELRKLEIAMIESIEGDMREWMETSLKWSRKEKKKQKTTLKVVKLCICDYLSVPNSSYEK